jgi:hypothetical protein
LPQLPDYAIIQVVLYPDNLVSDKGSRFRDGGIEDEQDAFIDRIVCKTNCLLVTTLTDKRLEAAWVNDAVLNDISWLV